jgi:hypothetical protein
MTKSGGTQLLEVRHLTSPEKYFSFPKLVFIIICDEVGQNLAMHGSHVVALYVLIFTQNSIPMEKIPNVHLELYSNGTLLSFGLKQQT